MSGNGGVPPALAALAVVAVTAFSAIPLVSLLLRVPWSRLAEVLSSTGFATSLRLSLICSLSAAAISVCLGSPLAWLLDRARFPGRELLRSIALLPMALPPVVGGVVLLMAFGRRGLVGELLYESTGLTLPFSTAGAVMAETFVAMPLVVFTLEGALRSHDRRLEEAALTLGATPWTVARRVTLPAIRPALVSAAVLAWGRALGEFGATLAFAGSVPGRTRTLPLEVFVALERDPEEALVGSLVMVALSVAVVALAWGRRDRRTEQT